MLPATDEMGYGWLMVDEALHHLGRPSDAIRLWSPDAEAWFDSSPLITDLTVSRSDCHPTT